MRKLFLAAFIAVIAGTSMNAQSDSGDFTIAPQIGVNLSSYSSPNRNYDLRTSFAGGAVVEYYFNNRWSLRSGLLYDAMGAKDAFGNVDKLNYLTIPINVNWHFGKKRNWFLNFGPAVSFLMSAKSELINGTEIDIKNVVSSVDVGFDVGIGYKFDLSDNMQLAIDYQGLNGFVDVVKEGEITLLSDIKNARSSFNVGLVFGL